MADTSGLLVREYESVNAHLRANIGQFVNWFSFFLFFSFAALAVFVATGERWPQPRLLRGTAARLGVRGRKRYFQARFAPEVEATWLGL